MPPSLCQGLQSCLEPFLVEPCVLRHKLSPQKSNFSQTISWPQTPNISRQHDRPEKSHNENNNRVDGDHKNNNGDFGGWNFMQFLTNKSYNCEEGNDIEKVYVHPLVKRSASTLSRESLEMCTESLGSETGSEISESMDEFSSISLVKHQFHGNQRLHCGEVLKKLKYSTSFFPPPLSSITGSDSVQVRPHREGGRLVIKAVTVASGKNYFQAERTNGRLRLSLLKKETESNEEDDEEDVKHENVGEVEVEEKWYNYEDHENGDDNFVDGGDCKWDDDDDHGVYRGEGMEENVGNVGGGVEIGEVEMARRCKEGGESGNKEMPKWGPFWVAT